MSATAVLVTGGAGFIGRWIVRALLKNGENVTAIDDLSNGSKSNLAEFAAAKNFLGLIQGNVRRQEDVAKAIGPDTDAIIHAAAQVNVQQSLEDPALSFGVNLEGTFQILEAARRRDAKLVIIGTCMVYDTASSKAITEQHRELPASPYAGSKLGAENLARSYFHGYGLPVVILRPFNTYGPFQKTNLEGGVISIFVRRHLEGAKLQVYGDGLQTRDFLYVEDCASFIVAALRERRAVGEVINAGTGTDVRIRDLARLVARGDDARIEHVPHHHPKSEIQRLVCDPTKARQLLNWRPHVSLEEGIERLRVWMRTLPSPAGRP